MINDVTKDKIDNTTIEINNDISIKEASGNKATEATGLFRDNLIINDIAKNKIDSTTTEINKDTSIKNASGNKANDVTTNFENKLQLGDRTKKEISNTQGVIEQDTTIGEASKTLGEDVDTNFNGKLNGWSWGWDLVTNIYNGLTNQQSRTLISSGASIVGSAIKTILGHSVPKEGPLKDELTYMPDMIDNLVRGIEKNKYKVTKATKQLAQEMKDGFNLEELNKEIVAEMQNAVAIETNAINAQAMLQVNKEQPMIIARDHTINIDNTQNFYEKNATPYEEQKQAKQQLRRLAYGL